MGDVVMGLTLSVLSYHRFTSDLEAKKTFALNDKAHSYTIGRSSQCDWCLPDPERVISGKHALIECRAGKFAITDLSTNGLFINRSIKALGKNKSQALSNGDLLTLGDYEIEVSLAKIEHKPDDNVYFANNADDFNKHNELNDNLHFGIPTRQLSQSPINEKQMNLAPQKQAAIVSKSELVGSLEDSFTVAVSDPCNFEDFGGLAIPEDWSESLGSAVYGRTEPAANQRDNEDELYAVSTPATETVSNTAIPPIGPDLADHFSPKVQAFIRGLGINPNMVPADSEEQWWFDLGLAMQDLMTGLMDTLHQRSAFKQNSRLNQTLFKRQENNPLKFSATVEDAIHNLFNRNGSSYLSADQAIKEAYSDIEKHEQALLAGVEGVVAGMMKLLSPESISARSIELSFWQRLTPAYSKSTNWDIYKAMYQRLEQDLDGANKAFYMDGFVKSYESYLKGMM